VKIPNRCFIPFFSRPLLAVFLSGVLIWAAPLAAAHLDIMLVLDNSGSMRRNDPQNLMKDVVTRFARELNPQTRLGIVVFGKGATLALPLTEIRQPEFQSSLEASLRKIDYSTALTDTPAGVERALYELRQTSTVGTQRIIILLTDGIVDVGNPEKGLERERWLRSNLAPNAHQLGIKIFAIAFTEEADFQLMQSVAQTTDGEYFRILRAQDIEKVFTQIGSKLEKSSTPAPPAPTVPLSQNPPTESVTSALLTNLKDPRVLYAGGAVVALMFFLMLAGLIRKRGKTRKEAPIEPPFPFETPTAALEPASSPTPSKLPDLPGKSTPVELEQTLPAPPPRSPLPPSPAERGRKGFEFPPPPASPPVPPSQAMCAKHPLWKATELCPSCQIQKCKNCMTEREGTPICTDCAKKQKSVLKF
jgi:uncharacterized protein YegL